MTKYVNTTHVRMDVLQWTCNGLAPFAKYGSHSYATLQRKRDYNAKHTSAYNCFERRRPARIASNAERLRGLKVAECAKRLLPSPVSKKPRQRKVNQPPRSPRRSSRHIGKLKVNLAEPLSPRKIKQRMLDSAPQQPADPSDEWYGKLKNGPALQGVQPDSDIRRAAMELCKKG